MSAAAGVGAGALDDAEDARTCEVADCDTAATLAGRCVRCYMRRYMRARRATRPDVRAQERRAAARYRARLRAERADA